MGRLIPALGTLVIGSMLATNVAAHEKGDLIVRIGAGIVDPKSDNLGFSADIAPGDFPELPDGASISANLQVDSGTSMVFGATYMLSRRFAVDLLLAAPFTHEIDLTGSVTIGSSAALPLDFGQIAEVKHLPPTLSLQYHFAPEARLQPYVGVGVNWTTFTSEELNDIVINVDGDEINLGPLGSTLDVDDSFGVAGQLGLDWEFAENLLLNLDIRYIEIQPDISIDGAEAPESLKIDPFVYSVNIGYRF